MITALFPPLISVAHATAISISTSVPGMAPNSSSNPGAFVAGFYQFALMIGGVLAFGIIVYGGVKYMASAGNPSGQGDAKEWIEAALLGLLLLVGAYFILNVVNPQLTNLALPKLTPVNIVSQATGSGCGSTTCPSGYVPTAKTSGNSTSCACQNADGTQGCGGSAMGNDPNSCGTGSTCAETNTSPVTFGCQATSSFTCGVGAPPNNYGNYKCANGLLCTSYYANIITKTIGYRCTSS